MIALVVVASIGAIVAWSGALKKYGGESWRDHAERLDTHPNLLDLAIYTAPGSTPFFGKIVYFVYPLYLTVALAESAWLQWWLVNSRAPGRWFFIVTWIVVWSRAVFLMGGVWRQRIARARCC